MVRQQLEYKSSCSIIRFVRNPLLKMLISNSCVISDFYFFFFSSRRRHTRYWRDWSSDVCSSDLRVFWEVYGSGEPTVLLLPTWSIIHSRHWKAQIPYLARHARVVTFDGRGNGRSDRPAAVEAYTEREYAADALAVMEATGTERAFIVGLSAGVLWGVLLAAEHPERVDGAVFIAPAAPFGLHRARATQAFDEPLESYEGWGKYNRYYWL